MHLEVLSMPVKQKTVSLKDLSGDSKHMLLNPENKGILFFGSKSQGFFHRFLRRCGAQGS